MQHATAKTYKNPFERNSDKRVYDIKCLEFSTLTFSDSRKLSDVQSAGCF